MAEKIIINADNKDVRDLTLCINGKDCVLKIDTKDAKLCKCLLEMSSEIINMQKKYEYLESSKDIEALKELANGLVNLSDKCYNDFCEIFPQFQKATNGVIIRSFDIWRKIMFSISQIFEEVQEKKTANKVMEAIADEMTEEIE